MQSEAFPDCEETKQELQKLKTEDMNVEYKSVENLEDILNGVSLTIETFI